MKSYKKLLSLTLLSLSLLSVPLYAKDKKDNKSDEKTDIIEENSTNTEESESDTTLVSPEEMTIYPLKDRIALEIEGVDHALTKKWIDYYLTPAGQKWLMQVLSDSIPYRPYIREQLIDSNLPLLLQYLPIVESSYKATAVSKAGATGMWQFMENSMYPFLKKNNWYDERRDPWKSTIAATKKLSDNYNIFGDWAIAIAAYNCGNGAMSKALKNSKEKDFWYLADHKLLRDQTVQYVPKLLAIADVIENAEYYGLIEIGAMDKMIEDTPSEKYDYITMAGMISLKEIAKITGIEENTVKFLNPALYRNCTPAGELYDLRLPFGTGEQAALALKENGSATDALIYTVVKGDSLWGISRRYGVTVADLCQVNNIKENDILSIGKKIIVPIFN